MTWWWEGNRLERITKGIAIAFLYAVLSWSARQISLDQFYLPAGIRVAALLLLPRSLWVYLLIGEYAYFAYMRIPMIEKYGLTWVVLGSITLMPSVAMIVHWHRKRMRAGGEAWALSACALSAITVTALNVSLANALWPIPTPDAPLTQILQFVVGDYVGMLTIVPLVLLWKFRREANIEVGRYTRSSTTTIAIMLLLGVGSLAIPKTQDLLISLLQTSMALPAIALTCMHGWRGAAIAVPILNLLMGVTSPPWTFDQSVFVTQQILAVAGTAMLCMGSSITYYYHQHRAGSRRKRLTIAHAKNAHVSAEMELRRRVINMKRVGDGIDHSLSEIAHWLREKGHHGLAEDLMRIAVANSRAFREETSMVYPTALEHVGLYLTLQISGIANEWSRTERVLAPRLSGDPCKLTVGLQLAAYRLLTEAVSLLLCGEKGNITVKARCGRISGHQGILILVAAADATKQLSQVTTVRLMARLTGRTLAYRGNISCRNGNVRIVLMERATTRTSIEHDLNTDPSAHDWDDARLM